MIITRSQPFRKGKIYDTTIIVIVEP